MPTISQAKLGELNDQTKLEQMRDALARRLCPSPQPCGGCRRTALQVVIRHETISDFLGGPLRQVGVLVNGVELIPLDIVRDHMTFAVPPGITVEAVYVKDED